MPKSAKLVMGAVDLGGTKIRSLVVDESGTIHGLDQRATEASEGKDAVIGRIGDSLSAALASSRLSAKQLSGLGVSAPGPVDFEGGVVLEAPNLPGWHEVQLATELGRRL